jgi:aspartyl-tRNA(Asn)/glutamyl-tRNA(Gln) amidotransferase subunit A
MMNSRLNRMRRWVVTQSREDIAFLSIGQLVSLFRSKALSPVEATAVALARIEALNPRVNAFSLVAADNAIRAARESEARWQKKAPLGPIDGVPLSVKDTLMVKGYPFRRGSKVTSTAPVGESAPIVDHALKGGAVMLGITTTPEYGAGPITISPLTGITRNPWNLAKNSGGSSGGAAAGTAAGMGHAALATDAGGSIRIPSGLCGVVGMKATGGRIPTYPPNVAGTLSSPGPIARCVTDVAILMSVLTQNDPRDVEALPADPGKPYVDDLKRDLRGLRIAVSTTLGYAPKVDPEIRTAVLNAARHFETLGAAVEETDPPIKNPIEFFLTLFRTGFAYSTRTLSDEQMKNVGELLREVVREGRNVPTMEYLAAQDERRALARAMESFFAHHDVLLTPTTASPAFTADRWIPEGYEEFPDSRAWTPFGYPFNMTQQPAVSVPCGFTAAGLPIGLQIAAPRFSDRLVLQVAHAYERTRGFEVGRPPL